MASQSEYITAEQAREILGVSRPKMTELLKPKDQGGLLEWVQDPVDRRVKLVKRADVERLAAMRPKKDAA